MTTYERTLIAHGISPEAARRDALANELVRLANREHPAYGVTDFPARHLTALPSRQVAGSYDDNFAQQMREGFRFKLGLAQEAR